MVLFPERQRCREHMSIAFSSLGFFDADGLESGASAPDPGSMCCLYSAQVVAATVRNSPRASAGFNRLAASPVPRRAPLPRSVCALRQ